MEKKDASTYLMECDQKIKNASNEELKKLGREICYLNQEGVWPEDSQVKKMFKNLAKDTGMYTSYALEFVKSAIVGEILERYTKD